MITLRKKKRYIEGQTRGNKRKMTKYELLTTSREIDAGIISVVCVA